jgi:hypothetical protein
LVAVGAEGSALCPKTVKLLPDVIVLPADCPTATLSKPPLPKASCPIPTLLLDVANLPALLPTNVLLTPVTLSANADSPIAVLLPPVVELAALKPTAVEPL